MSHDWAVQRGAEGRVGGRERRRHVGDSTSAFNRDAVGKGGNIESDITVVGVSGKESGS